MNFIWYVYRALTYQNFCLGETNLKIRNSIPQTRDLDAPAKVSTLRYANDSRSPFPIYSLYIRSVLKLVSLETFLSGVFEFEPPNNRLYTFSGKLMRPGQEDVPVDNDNILLRGAMLRNTDWIFGQVIHTQCYTHTDTHRHTDTHTHTHTHTHVSLVRWCMLGRRARS